MPDLPPPPPAPPPQAPAVAPLGRRLLAESVGTALLLFALPAVQMSGQVRSGAGLWIGEVVATTGLIAVIVALARTGRPALSAGAVAAWIGAAYWFTSSTSFANPAVTVARMFSDTFAGINPASVPPFVVFQVVGAALGAVLVVVLYPDVPQTANAIVVPHDTPRTQAVDGTTW